MKILFLDIDGVVNCKDTIQRHRGFIGIDPYMAFMVGKIVLDTDCKVVLSSSWRHSEDGVEEVRRQVCEIFDMTGSEPTDTARPYTIRGREVQAWLDAHPEVERYAILDDESDFLDEQTPNRFKTSWSTGITEEIAAAVTAHLNHK